MSDVLSDAIMESKIGTKSKGTHHKRIKEKTKGIIFLVFPGPL